MPDPIDIPASFRSLVAGRAPEPDVSGDDWLRSLPKLLGGALARWELTVDGRTRHGLNAVVVPVRTSEGTPAALKVTWPHAESRDEHLSLRAWAGDGAVELLAADPSRSTLLLERLDGDRNLDALEPYDACEIIGGLLRRLDRPALPRTPRLSGWAQRTSARLASPEASVVPRRFTRQTRSILAEFLKGDLDGRLVHTDLHYENVLDGPRGWLAIDPKAMAAEPEFGVWPALHNRLDTTEPGLAWDVHSRLGWICDAGDLHEDRARGWALARTLVDAMDAARAGDDRRLTSRITLAKALAQRW